MKQITGMLIILLSIAFVAIIILKIWRVHIVSLDFLLKGSLSLILTSGLLTLLTICYGYFFKNPGSGYDSRKGSRAHPKM